MQKNILKISEELSCSHVIYVLTKIKTKSQNWGVYVSEFILSLKYKKGTSKALSSDETYWNMIQPQHLFQVMSSIFLALELPV